MPATNGIRTDHSLPHGHAYGAPACLMTKFGLNQYTLRHQHLESAAALSLTLFRAGLGLRTSFQRCVGRYGNATAITRKKTPFTCSHCRATITGVSIILAL